MGRLIQAGQIWAERRTGRRIVILDPDYADIGPSWTYVDDSGSPEPDGPAHPGWYVHYCDVLDFTVWGRFERV